MLTDAFFKWVEAPTWRWAPLLLLALYATLDFLAQYLLAATPLVTVLPPDVRDFMKVSKQAPAALFQPPDLQAMDCKHGYMHSNP